MEIDQIKTNNIIWVAVLLLFNQLDSLPKQIRVHSEGGGCTIKTPGTGQTIPDVLRHKPTSNRQVILYSFAMTSQIKEKYHHKNE